MRWSGGEFDHSTSNQAPPRMPSGFSPLRVPNSAPGGQGGFAPSSGTPGFPQSGPAMGMPPVQGGSIRQTLGSELKRLGVFQKDGKIQNSRGGLFGLGGKTMGSGPFSFLGNGRAPGMMQPRQLILEAAQPGIPGNGIATISPDNVFSCIANLPDPNTFGGQGMVSYAAYLVDSKGQTGFLAGILRPVGSGAYQAQFRSQVPLAHYSRVLITLENPRNMGHVPKGPLVLQVKQPLAPARFTEPILNAGGSAWKKISGMIQRRFGGSGATGGDQPVSPPVNQTGNPAVNPSPMPLGGSMPGHPGPPNE